LAALVGGVVASFFSEIRIGTLVVAGLSAAVASIFKVLSKSRDSEASRLHKELEEVAERDSKVLKPLAERDPDVPKEIPSP
jgi:membrane protein implicated in regulation of membrane protease activity